MPGRCRSIARAAPGRAAGRDLLPQLEPTIPGWFGVKNQFDFDIRHVEYPDTALRLEQGTHSISAVYAFLGGLSYVREIGPQTLRERTQRPPGSREVTLLTRVSGTPATGSGAWRLTLGCS